MRHRRLRHLTAGEKAAMRDIAEANGFAPCTHPDCDPKQPSCASNYMFLRALDVAEAAYRRGCGVLGWIYEQAVAKDSAGKRGRIAPRGRARGKQKTTRRSSQPRTAHPEREP